MESKSSNVIQRAEENPQQLKQQQQQQQPVEGELRNKEFPSSESSNVSSGDYEQQQQQKDKPLSERIREAQNIQEPVQIKQEESKKSKAEQNPIGGRQEGITSGNYGVYESPSVQSNVEPSTTTTNEPKITTTSGDNESFISGSQQETTSGSDVGIKESKDVNEPLTTTGSDETKQFEQQQQQQQESSNEPWSESQKKGEWDKPELQQSQQSNIQEPISKSNNENVQWKPTSNEPTNEPTSNISQFKKDEMDTSSQQRSHEQLPSGFNQMKNEIDYGEHSYKGNNRLMGRKVLISGDEYGRGVVISFIREGADVCFNYLPNRQKEVDSLYQLLENEIKENNRKLEFIPGDLKNESFCKELVNEAKNKLGGLDCLVLTAGRQREFQDITELSLDDFRETFEVNLFSMFNIVKAAVPHLSKGSTIITTSSIEAFKTPSNLLDYSSSKAAVVSFTTCLSKQLASKGIRVNSIAPGNIVTSRHPSIKVENSDFKRCGQPFELSSLFVYLASNESSFCTGSIYPLSGGNVF